MPRKRLIPTHKKVSFSLSVPGSLLIDIQRLHPILLASGRTQARTPSLMVRDLVVRQMGTWIRDLTQAGLLAPSGEPTELGTRTAAPVLDQLAIDQMGKASLGGMSPVVLTSIVTAVVQALNGVNVKTGPREILPTGAVAMPDLFPPSLLAPPVVYGLPLPKLPMGTPWPLPLFHHFAAYEGFVPQAHRRLLRTMHSVQEAQEVSDQYDLEYAEHFPGGHQGIVANSSNRWVRWAWVLYSNARNGHQTIDVDIPKEEWALIAEDYLAYQNYLKTGPSVPDNLWEEGTGA